MITIDHTLAQPDPAALVLLLGELRLGVIEDERQLHDAIAELLMRHGYAFVHEARLGARSRVDFLVGGVAIEAKAAAPNAKRWIDQLKRYASNPAVTALVLATQRGVKLPKTILGKPVFACSLRRAWGVALK